MTVFRVISKLLCLIVMNIAVVIIADYLCKLLMAFTIGDGSYYVSSCFYLFHLS